LFGVFTNDDIVIKIENEQSFTIIPDLQYYSIIFLGNNLNIGKSLSAIWWGEKLKNCTKEDQWFIGSLQTYSGYLLTQIGMNDTNEIFIQLNKSKNELFKINGKVDSEEETPVIIAYGEINNQCAQFGTFENLICHKGAWVLHMLRNLFIDFDTMDDKIFFAMLKEFFGTYKDSYATTQDFVNIVSKYAGTDMKWFFEQWVESNEMPTYTFGYKKEKTPEGKYKVTARIKQTGVNEKFMMSVPVKVDYGESYRVLRLNVTKPFIEFEFPLFDVEPKKFQLNAYESVLCEVEYDDFEDIEP
jgi:aminopeptidase N